MGVLLQFSLVIAFTAWAVYMWAHVEHFGPQSYLNNDVKYIVFHDVRATKPWLRCLWIFILVASALVLMIQFGLTGWALYHMRHEEGEQKTEEEEQETEEEEQETEELEKEWYCFISYGQIMCVILFLPHDVLTDYCIEPQYTLLSR